MFPLGYLNFSRTLFDNTITYGKSKAGSLAHFLGGGVHVGVEALDVFAEVAVVVRDDALVFFERLLVFFDLRAGDPHFVLEFLEAVF